MRFSYSNAQMREADRRTIEGGAPSYLLMERAGKALFEVVKRACADNGEKEVIFVCGGGNNGGDGFIAAQECLLNGIKAEVLCLAKSFTPDCERAKNAFQGDILGKIPRKKYALLADCILGTGISRAPEGDAATLIEFIRSCGGYVISADIPSGLSENGVAFTPCVIANETVCMGLMKNCLLMCDGVDVAGEVTVVDIGISAQEAGAEIWEKADVLSYFPKKKSNVHKGTFGDACILAGNPKYSGACFLATKACLKSGAGYTRFFVSEPIYSRAIGIEPACILREYREIDGEILSCDAVAVGMGAGVSDSVYQMLKDLLKSYTGTLVIDADAINTLSSFGAEILKEKACEVIITPHPKEFSLLIGKSVGETLSRAVEYAKQFALEYGVTVVLKNNRTVITDGRRVAINTTGSPAMAKGGSGDVLTGLLAGTCARGIAPFEASCVACYVLGRAGELSVGEMGEYSPDASDLVAFLPRSIVDLSK